MTEFNDLTVTVPPGVTGVAVFNGTEVLVLRDDDAAREWEFMNPVVAEIMCARLRAWANFIEWRTAREAQR